MLNKNIFKIPQKKVVLQQNSEFLTAPYISFASCPVFIVKVQDLWVI